MPQPWFRWYTEAMADPKIRGLSYAHRWLWITVLSAARTAAVPGYLLVAEDLPWTDFELAEYGGLKVREVREGLLELHRRRMIEHSEKWECWHVTKWEERQFESDSSTTRTRAYRRRKERSGDVTGTSQERFFDVPGERAIAEQSRAERDLPKPRARDPIWDALVEVFGDATFNERQTMYGKAVRAFKDQGVEPEEIVLRGNRLPKDWNGCTPMALLKHWDTLGASAGPVDKHRLEP